MDVHDRILSCSKTAHKVFILIKNAVDRRTNYAVVPISMPSSKWYPAVKEIEDAGIAIRHEPTKRTKGMSTFFVNPDCFYPWDLENQDIYQQCRDKWALLDQQRKDNSNA